MPFSNPFELGAKTGSTATSQVISLPNAPTNPGDCILIVCGSTSATGATVNSVSDTQGNTYRRALASAVTTNEFLDVWISEGTNTLSGLDTITVTWSSTTGTKSMTVVDVPGAALAGAVDQKPTNHGSGTSFTVSTGTLATGGEMAIAFLNNTAGISPSYGGAWTIVFQDTGSLVQTTVYQEPGSTSALTFSGTFASASWSAAIITLLPAGGAVPAPITPVPGPAVIRAATY